jgi:signal transduction histidine kinase
MGWWVLPGVAGALVIGGLGVALAIRRPVPPLWPVALLGPLCGFLWCVGELVSSSASDPRTLWLGLATLYAGSIWIAPTAWITTLRYAEVHGMRPRWLTRDWERGAVAVAAAFSLLMLTNPWHGGFVTPVVGGRNPYGPGFQLLLLVNYAEILGAIWLCLRLARRHRERDVRRSGAVFAAALLIPLVSNAAFVLSNAYLPAHFTGLALTAAVGLASVALYGTRALWMLPIAIPEILRHDPSGIALIGRGGRAFYWNPAAERLLTALPLSHDLELWPALAEHLRAENGRTLEAREIERELEDATPAGRIYRGPNGGDARLRLSAVAVRTRNRRRRVATVLRIEDVTAALRAERDRRALEDQLRRSEHLRSLAVLAGGLAHDFNNRLTAILGNAELALQRAGQGSPVQPFLEAIEDTSLRAADLTQQLLCYAGQAPSFRRSVDLSQLVNESRPLLEAALSRGAMLQVLAADALRVEADPAQLRQVLVNLVANAAEALAEGPGEVTVQTGSLRLEGAPASGSGEIALRPGRYAFVEVADCGPGMDEGTLRHVFEPFFSTRFIGRGLGLAAAQGIVRAHGGEIRAESEPERGSTFCVLLPQREGDGAERSEQSPRRSPLPSAWRGQGRALLIEDELDVRRVATSLLEGLGFNVDAATSGREGLERFAARLGEIRFVLLDLTLPDMGTDELVGELRRLAPHVPILASSGYDRESSASRLQSAKLDGFVSKPYGLDALRAAVQGLLEKRT